MLHTTATWISTNEAIRSARYAREAQLHALSCKDQHVRDPESPAQKLASKGASCATFPADTRIARAVDLLRTRVNLTQEEDTAALLEGMNRTARTQLRLQHAVEGLSVAAISYYVLNLIAAGFRALHAANVPLDPEIAEGLFIIPVIATVLALTRWLRQRHDIGEHEDKV